MLEGALHLQMKDDACRRCDAREEGEEGVMSPAEFRPQE